MGLTGYSRVMIFWWFCPIPGRLSKPHGHSRSWRHHIRSGAVRYCANYEQIEYQPDESQLRKKWPLVLSRTSSSTITSDITPPVLKCFSLLKQYGHHLRWSEMILRSLCEDLRHSQQSNYWIRSIDECDRLARMFPTLLITEVGSSTAYRWNYHQLWIIEALKIYGKSVNSPSPFATSRMAWYLVCLLLPTTVLLRSQEL